MNVSFVIGSRLNTLPLELATLELKAYEILKSKLGAEEAEIVIDYIENKVEKSVERNIKSLATKEDLSKVKEELTITKAELKVDIANVKSDMLRAVYIVGLVQFPAIVGSVIAIISFLAK